MRHHPIGRLFAGVVVALAGAGGYLAAQPRDPRPSDRCEALSSLMLSDGTVTLARVVERGTFVPPGAAAVASGNSFADLPGFCRLAATLTPSSDSDIKIEVWLPTEEWNGRFQAVGNGGWSGAIAYGALAAALRQGYATASTDTGHTGGSGVFALGHPEKLVDFGYRAVHLMTVAAKSIVTRFYRRGPAYSYWVGCSSGGKQGLKEAQRFPDDYDGIVAGAPANYWTHLTAHSLWVAHATLKDPAGYIPRDKYALLHDAVMKACDAGDGVEDGVLENPAACRFDPAALRCTGAETPACLTAPQVEAARRIYGPATNPRTGEVIFPGLARGSEKGWAALAGGPNPFSIASDHFKYVVFQDPEWDFKTLDFDRDVARADAVDGGLLNAVDPDLRPFVERGGKLLMWHGWNDQLIAPENSIDYFKTVESALGGPVPTREAVRLFMAPGVAHCRGGDGPDTFDMLGALERWVEDGVAPDSIVASRAVSGRVVRTRPLCPYPQVASYTGRGSRDEAGSFVCR